MRIEGAAARLREYAERAGTITASAIGEAIRWRSACKGAQASYRKTTAAIGAAAATATGVLPAARRQPLPAAKVKGPHIRPRWIPTSRSTMPQRRQYPPLPWRADRSPQAR